MMSMGKAERRGMALVWVIFAATVLVGSSFVMTTLSMSARNVAEATRKRGEAEALAQGGLNLALQEIEVALAATRQPEAQGNFQIDGQPVTYTVTQLAPPVMTAASDGLQAFVATYGVDVRATVLDTTVSQRTIVAAEVIPVFQYAFFYETDMHFDWPAPMVINGPVHTNGDVFFSNWQMLRFNTNNFTVAGRVRLWTKYDALMQSGVPAIQRPVEIRQWVDDPFDPMHSVDYENLEPKVVLDGLGIPNQTGYDSDFLGYDFDGDGDFYDTNDWLPFGPGVQQLFDAAPFYAGSGSGQTLRTGQHGVNQVELPPISDRNLFVDDANGDFAWSGVAKEYVPVAPGTGTHSYGPLRQAADLVLEVDSSGSWVAYDKLGTDVTAALAPAISSTTIYDARQAESNGVKLDALEIDVGVLNSLAIFPTDGTFYVAQNGAGTGTDAFGFIFENAATLAADMSIVSPDSVYIQGDFNVNAPKSAAAIADAVNLLSNAWSKSKGKGQLPVASSTTYNLAVLTGETEYTSTQRNGGPHNLVRFHEDWRGVDCTITGSMVCPGNSERATGSFLVGSDRYYAPNRIWSFDPRFRDLNQLPPGTPSVVRLENVVSW